MNEVVKRWNKLDPAAAAREILSCCGSTSWSEEMTTLRPFADEASLLISSDEVWRGLEPADWLEAFKSHPRIGESRASVATGERSEHWSGQEQKNVSTGAEDVKQKLAEGNRIFEEKFGYIFIVCAAGKSATEILAILQRRLQNGPEAELREAAEEQRQITQLRLTKWLGI